MASRRTLSPRRLHRDEHEPSSRAGRRFLQKTWDVRATDQGRQGGDQVDAAVVPNVRRQRGAAPASCARLQPRQFPAHAGDAGADQGLVADESEGQADQDRREGRQPRPLCRLPDGRGRHPTANVPGDSAARRGTAAAATTSASMRRSTVMRSRATDGMSASECQGKRPDQAVKDRSDGRECREPSTLSHLGFQPVQKTSTIHVSSGFIWGIPMKTNGQARGARCVEGTGITDLRPLVDSLDTYARQIHSIAEIIRSIKEESAEQSTEAKAAENTAPCSLHDGQQHLTSTPVISGTLDRTPVIEAHAAPVVDTISPEAIWQRVSGARKATEARAIEWMPDKVYQDGCAAVGGGELDKLHAEFRAAGEKLREELRDALARLPVVDQERRELERALNQSNLDARDERVAGAIEAATVKLRGELGDAGGKLRHELNAATSKLHDEINTRFARLPIEVKTWEPVGEALDQIRQQAQEQARSELQAAVATLRDEFNAATSKLHDEINTRLARLPLEVKTWEPVGEAPDQIRQQAEEQARSELQAAVATLRDEFNAATSKLHNEINTRLARLPLVQAWEPDAVHYTGDVVTHDGSVYQARKDTGKEPGHQDWILLARAGRDGCDGLTPNFCGVFDARETYARLDIVECDGVSFVACRDN